MPLKDYPWLLQSLAKLPDPLPAALLIYGQAGIGKQILAENLAQGLLCGNSDAAGTACGRCSSCHLFGIGNHPDYRLVQSESEAEEGGDTAPVRATKGKRPSKQIRVDAIRNLTELVTSVSHLGGAKVVVIALAETLHPSAGNALLKMLEEPHGDTYFILVASEPHRILPTIKSRCFKLSINVPSADVATAWLAEKTEQHRDATLQAASYAPVAALALSGDADFWRYRADLMSALSESNPDMLQLAIDAERLEPEIVGRLLGMWAFDLMAVLCGGDIRYFVDMPGAVTRTAKRMSGPQLRRWSDAVRDYTRASAHPLNRRLALESLFAKWPA